MTAPVVTVGEEAEIDEVARLLTAHRIKRVPVLRDGRIVGIVSRADLVGALAEPKMRACLAGYTHNDPGFHQFHPSASVKVGEACRSLRKRGALTLRLPLHRVQRRMRY